MGLQGQVAKVTGAGSGVGRATALEPCTYGYMLPTGRVVLQGLHRTRLADRAYLGM